MRILQICSAREIGGGEKHLADLANSLANRGHEIFAAIIPGSPVRAELSALRTENIIELPMRNALSVRSALKLSRLVREQGIGVVHAHLARDYPLAALAARNWRTKLVLTRHVLFPLSAIHRLTLRRTSRVIAVSQAVADSLKAQKIFSPEKIVTIHNGIDVKRFEKAIGRTDFSPLNQAQSTTRIRVGMIGHLAPIKGQEDFVRAAAIVCRGREDVDFIIAGEDKSRTGENREAIERLVRELKLESNVQLTGWVDDVPALLKTFDIFVSPARSEPFGLSIVEAMAATVPVIATASEGAGEIIEPNNTGRLAPIGDAPALAREITDLLKNARERARLAANARAAVAARFSLERMVQTTEDLYREVVGITE